MNVTQTAESLPFFAASRGFVCYYHNETTHYCFSLGLKHYSPLTVNLYYILTFLLFTLTFQV